MAALVEEYLPAYRPHDSEEDVHYGIDVLLSPQTGLALQCDKYRDYHTINNLPSGVIEILQYAQDNNPAQVIGVIAKDRFRLFQSDVQVTVKNKFRMTRAQGPLCIYSEFDYDGKHYVWRVKYKMQDHHEVLHNCVLLRDEKIVASFIPDSHARASGVNLLGQLFIACRAAQWPTVNIPTKDRVLEYIRYHAKDRHADMMLVSFVALWKKILKESLKREGISRVEMYA
ncbi:protein of unknown function [Taphrina deformans PYCC 5710]|uniref:Uncharacterized protein n=1 Tax=Taphrina deformans (strain PYCC 5710 / ATCC 11124 / CBS 356.35 / IMI 108563 / JCM 9778 / NBRC 8474) TaxID=1097556 RepID=R4XGF6_TAPDE|nr:protein of unknown function [Taphrina deformans PYCC 5710]|eukprot:CCG83569.1 protein of unknown function [Taphrina deformans PYCC 5710]